MEQELRSVLSLNPESVVTKTQDKTLQGSVLVLIQFDVCEEIRLDDLRDIFGARRQEARAAYQEQGTSIAALARTHGVSRAAVRTALADLLPDQAQPDQ